MKKFVIMAARGVGKTTLVNRLLEALEKSSSEQAICGFFTRKFPERSDEEGIVPVYIFPVNGMPVFDNEHCIGLCGNGNHYTNYDVFNDAGVLYLKTENADQLVILDEVGFMELGAESFKSRIFEILSSENPVLLMLKERMDVEFLRSIRDFEGVEFIEMTEGNRDAVFERVRDAFI